MSEINDFENRVLCVFSEKSDYSLMELRKAFILCNKLFDLLRRCVKESMMQEIDLIEHAESFHESFFDVDAKNE